MALVTRQAVRTIIKAAGNIDKGTGRPWTEFDLTVETWKLDSKRFGLRGYEDLHPDHKRVVVECSGKKPYNPVRLGYFQRVSPCTFVLTPLGQAVAASIDEEESVTKLLTGLLFLLSSQPYFAWTQDPAKPSSVADLKPILESGSLAGPIAVVDASFAWCQSKKVTMVAFYNRRRAVPMSEISPLMDFMQVMRSRFPKLVKSPSSIR